MLQDIDGKDRTDNTSGQRGEADLIRLDRRCRAGLNPCRCIWVHVRVVHTVEMHCPGVWRPFQRRTVSVREHERLPRCYTRYVRAGDSPKTEPGDPPPAGLRPALWHTIKVLADEIRLHLPARPRDPSTVRDRHLAHPRAGLVDKELRFGLRCRRPPPVQTPPDDRPVDEDGSGGKSGCRRECGTLLDNELYLTSRVVLGRHLHVACSKYQTSGIYTGKRNCFYGRRDLGLPGERIFGIDGHLSCVIADWFSRVDERASTSVVGVFAVEVCVSDSCRRASPEKDTPVFITTNRTLWPTDRFQRHSDTAISPAFPVNSAQSMP